METVAALIARHLLSILGLAFVDARAVRIALCAVVIALDVHLYQVLCRSHREDVLGYVVGSWLFAGIIFTTYFLALTPNPRKTFRLRDSVDPQTMSQKLIWSIKVHSSPRLIGFEGQAAKIPRALAIRRREFVTQQLKNVILETLVTGGLWLPVVWFNLIDFIHPAERRLPSLKQEAIRRLWATALGLYSARWSLNTVYEILSILSVGIGLTQPKEWPPFFGSIFEGTTLAKCWGHVWHQSFRPAFGAYGDFVAGAGGAPQGSQIWWCIKVTIAFAASTWVHAAGDYVMFKGRIWFSPQFFMAQPFALILEAAVIRMADSHRVRQRFPVLSTITGYAWVIAWFSLTYPNWSHEFEVSTMGTRQRMDFPINADAAF